MLRIGPRGREGGVFGGGVAGAGRVLKGFVIPTLKKAREIVEPTST